jgi:acetyl-CoA carboxylase alpha subunit
VREALSGALEDLAGADAATLPESRYERLRRIGEVAGA